MLPTWFLWMNGAALFFLGGVLFYLRLQDKKEASWGKIFGFAWSLMCITAGILLTLMAQGLIHQPGVK